MKHPTPSPSPKSAPPSRQIAPAPRRGKQDFAGSVALVLGASSGIGRAVALELARRGAILVVGGRKLPALREVAAEARALGADASPEVVDVRDAASVQSAVETAVLRHGRIDLFVNSAGTALLGYADETSLEQWRDMVETNLMGAIHGVAAVYPVMKARGAGHIVNVASLAGLQPIPASTAYCATKYAVVGLTEALRTEATAHGVKVSVVCPAAVETALPERAVYVNFDPAKVHAKPPPGGLMAADACARAILDGIRKDRAVITPGVAAPLARLSRLLPGAWRAATKRMAKQMDAAYVPPEARPARPASGRVLRNGATADDARAATGS